MRHTTRPSARLVAVVGALALALTVASPAVASESAATRGQQLLQAVEGGQRECADLNAADFEAIGEFAMGRMSGSPEAHESMDQLAAQMMGTDGLEPMHQAMGQRFAACGQPEFPGGFAQMMGMMPGMGGAAGYPGGGGMMGGTEYGPGDRGPSGGGGPGSMMDSSRYDGGDDDYAGWMVGSMLVLILGAAALAYVVVRRRPRSDGGALEVLARRFAAGEISADEYAERRRLLQGGSR